MSLQNLFSQYLQHGKYLKGWSPRTENWVVWMRSAEVSGYPHKRNLSPACVNIYEGAMNSFCAWLKDEGHLAEELKLKQVPAPLKPITVFTDSPDQSI